ncbi:MAG: amidohydrolase family protein [Alphaproteobacteria bacterium]|nr:amidohydrolase family protein [Alphaproteobacteria bacterium]
MNDVTLIRNAACVVGWDRSAKRHVYLTDCDVAFSGGEIIHVGPGYAGAAATTVDGARAMVMPGLVDVHCHPFSEPMNKGMWDEIGSPRLYNTSLYEYLTVLEPDPAGTRACYGVALAELLMSGVTTICDLSPPSEGWLDILGDSGLRACVAPLYRSGRWLTRNGHVVEYEWNEKAGERGLDTALREIAKAEQHASGRLFGMLSPSQVDTCTEGLLRDSVAAARERNLSLTIHAAQSLAEFHEITRRHGRTPIEWLGSLGVLGPRTLIGHGIFLDHHPWTHWPRVGDLERLAETGTTVAHCPTVFARRGIALTHFGLYREKGVRLGIGTDVYPHNMLDEMRLACYVARLKAEAPWSTYASDVFTAATASGADALARPDLGRLCVGAKADLVLVDIRHPSMQPARDPLRSLIYSASERAVKDVYVDGRRVVADGKCLTIDYAAAAAALHEAQQRALREIPRHDWAGRDADAMAPPSLPRADRLS